MFNINSETRNDFEPMGGYMPRIILRKLDDGGRFVVLLLRMFTDCSFDLVELFFEDDCRLIKTETIADKAILGSRTHHLKKGQFE